jgi:hypothetical protein
MNGKLILVCTAIFCRLGTLLLVFSRELFRSFEYTLHSGIFTPACGVLLWLALPVLTEESWRWCGPTFGPTLQARCAGFGLGVHRSEVHSHGADAPILCEDQAATIWLDFLFCGPAVMRLLSGSGGFVWCPALEFPLSS